MGPAQAWDRIWSMMMSAPSPRGPLRLAAVSAVSLFLLAGACKDEPKITVTSDGSTKVVAIPGGAVVEAAEDGASLEPLSELPRFAPAYPGAQLATRVTGGVRGEDQGVLVVFRTPDAVDKVIAFYDAQAKSAGASASVIVTEADSAVRIFGGESGANAEGAMVAITRSDEGPGTEIVITSGMAKADVARVEKEPGAWRETVRMPVRLQ
jgi:hypothetical protein